MKLKKCQQIATVSCGILAALTLTNRAWGAGDCLDPIQRASAQAERGQIHQALLTYFEALSCNPNVIEGQFTGNLESFNGLEPEEKAWQKGASLAQRTVLVYSVKGNGDSLQFARFLKELVKKGPKRIYFAVPQSLKRLMADSFRDLPSIEVRDLGEAPVIAKSVDLHAPLLSLPYLLGVDKISDAPYLRTTKVSDVQLNQNFLNVGIVLSGDPNHPHNKDRSFTTKDLEPLNALKAVHFYTLQPGSGDVSRASGSGPAISSALLENVKDYADTAAVISRLDAVISADTSVSHLAAALGTRTFVPLPHKSDLRYAGKARRTEWYRDMMLLRQTKPGDWADPIQALRSELEKFPRRKR